MLQVICHPRTSRIVKPGELARYRQTATYRRARARETRRDLLALIYATMAAGGFFGAVLLAAHWAGVL